MCTVTLILWGEGNCVVCTCAVSPSKSEFDDDDDDDVDTMFCSAICSIYYVCSISRHAICSHERSYKCSSLCACFSLTVFFLCVVGFVLCICLYFNEEEGTRCTSLYFLLLISIDFAAKSSWFRQAEIYAKLIVCVMWDTSDFTQTDADQGSHRRPKGDSEGAVQEERTRDTLRINTRGAARHNVSGRS